MFKKIISVTLALLLALSVTLIAASADDDAEPSTVISFDTTTTGWKDFSYVGFHIWSIDDDKFTGYDWGGKKQRGTDAGDGIWTYDVAAKGLTLTEGRQYAVIFYTDKGQQTYNLLFDTTCLGDTAYADTSQVFENPEDSQKTALPAYWRNQDPAVNGPELRISSIGNVVGSCRPRCITLAGMLGSFIDNTLANAREFSGLSDQEIIDNIGEGLQLTADEVRDVIAVGMIKTEWSYDDSRLPKYEPTPGGDTEVPYTVTVTRGEGTASGDKDVLTINYSLPPEYAYDVVTLTATPSEGSRFIGWEIVGEYGAEGEDPDLTSPVITIRAYEGITANAMFAYVITPTGVRGDADGDGQVTIMDANRIQRFIAEMVGEDELDMAAADADGDGQVTIMDATRIQRVLAELCDMDGNSDEEPTEGEIPAQIATEAYELPII